MSNREAAIAGFAQFAQNAKLKKISFNHIYYLVERKWLTLNCAFG